MNASATTITCLYRNETSKMQIARIENAEFHLERLVLPGQCLMFEAPADALLQIHGYAMASALLEDTIPCQQLQQRVSETVVLAMPVNSSPLAA